MKRIRFKRTPEDEFETREVTRIADSAGHRAAFYLKGTLGTETKIYLSGPQAVHEWELT